MKKITLPSFLLILLTTLGCQREATVQEVMDNEAKRKEVYALIMDNPEMRREMMATMREHPERGMMDEMGMMGQGHMMKGDTAGMMMTDMTPEEMHNRMQQMVAACSQDSANCNTMTLMMMNNRQMMQHMMLQMHEKNMMSEACYQQMMQNMNQNRR